MNRSPRLFPAACLALLLAAQQSAPVLAFRTPGAAVAGAKRLQQGMADGRDDISFSPILLELAKLIGRTGLPAGFFLQNDSPSFPDDSGVDLRSLLLYQAGLIKMPVRMSTTHKSQTKPDGPPEIAIPSIPESRKQLWDDQPSDLPSLASTPLPRAPVGDQVVSPKASVGSPNRISISAAGSPSGQPATAPMLAFDVAGLHTDLSSESSQPAQTQQLNAEIPRLAMAMPRLNSMPFITNNAFRLWTYRQDAPELTPRTTSIANGTIFNGTFVVASTGAIKSITGRHFTLGPGRLLASNHGGELLFRTGLAEISVDPEATAVIEVVAQGALHTVKVFALGSQDSHAVTVNIQSGKEKSFQLISGEVLIIGDHQLSDAELAGNHTGKKTSSNIARGTFSVPQFLDKEIMLKSDRPVKASERYMTLSTLKHKLSTSP